MIDKKLNELFNNINKKYNYNMTTEKLEKDPAKCLNQLQELNNIIYKKEGLTDTTLDLQVWINKKRHELDIPDPKEIIHTDKDGKTFVQ